MLMITKLVCFMGLAHDSEQGFARTQLVCVMRHGPRPCALAGRTTVTLPWAGRTTVTLPWAGRTTGPWPMAPSLHIHRRQSNEAAGLARVRPEMQSSGQCQLLSLHSTIRRVRPEIQIFTCTIRPEIQISVQIAIMIRMMALGLARGCLAHVP